jgi:formate dehydrogenase alpha subunit
MPGSTTDTVKVTIDDQTLTVPKGTLVIEAARQAGVMIPHFCYHPKLKPDANCRMCLVEIERMPKLQTACSTPVAEGMVVRTATTVVNDAHKSVLEFILANHPLDCPVCDQGGRCDLQDFSHEYTPTTSRFVEVKRIFQKEYFSPLIEKQMNRCVQCLRCVRYCDEVMDVKALAPVNRGTMTEIKHFSSHELDCEFCGGCVQICPVGAITSRLSMYEFRPWMLKRADSVCGYCGDGCQLTFQTKGNDLVEVNSSHGAGRNNGDLCARGYFGYHANTSPDRLRVPLIRRNGRLEEATWEEALEYVAEKTLQLKLKHGSDAFAGLITARCTNEDLFVFQKFMRLVLGSNSFDSSARYGHLNGIRALRRVQGTHRWSISFDDIAAAEALLLVGTNITETNPITALKVKEAVKKRGATLITVESLVPAIGTISNITNLSTHHFAAAPDRFKAIVLGLIKGVVEEGLVALPMDQRAPGYVQAIGAALQALPWSRLEQAGGASAVTLRAAARAFARTSRAVILIGPGVLRTTGGSDLVTTLLDLLLLSGHHDRPGCGVAPLAEENNELGAVEMGAVPEYLPGACEITDRAATDRLAMLWKEDLPSAAGRYLMQILEGAQTGQVKAAFVVGENPVGSLPPSAKAQDALRALDLLVVQELFLTETAALAHVVLPACSYAEKAGTFINTEGVVQPVHQAIDPVGESRPDWEILSALSVLMGAPLEYGNAKEIGKEIRQAIPGYGLLGPGHKPAMADPAVIEHYLREGYQEDAAQRYALDGEGQEARGQGTLTLLVGQTLFHSGKFSTYAEGLLQIQATGTLLVSPGDAGRLGVVDGDHVRLSNEFGQATTPLKVADRLPDGLIFFPEHFDQDVRRLLNVTIDQKTGVPYYKTSQVQVEKAYR